MSFGVPDQEILLQLEKERLLFFTPSRNVGGKRMVCYEDRYILKMAAQTDGVVVSNDNYRDLVAESVDFKRVVEERLLMYTFVNDRCACPRHPVVLPPRGSLYHISLYRVICFYTLFFYCGLEIADVISNHFSYVIWRFNLADMAKPSVYSW